MSILKQILWDNDVNKLNKDSNLIIERVLNFGEIEDYKRLKEEIGEEKIKKFIINNYKDLNKKSLNFWKTIFGIKKIKNNNLSMYDQLNTPTFRRDFR